MKLISWNVNGLRACLGKGFLDFFQSVDADIFCIQETKMQPDQAVIETPGYHQYWNSAIRKGYAGTAIFSKEEPLSVQMDIGVPEHQGEGRAITLEFPGLYVMTLYSPNAQRELTRLEYRLEFEKALREYLTTLREKKPVLLCGDLNVAHEEIDLKNPGPNRSNAGFTPQEREAFSKLLKTGMIDTFRRQYPDREGAYTWWSYQFGARARNAGWRIDYVLASQELESMLGEAMIFPEIMGSDHCPVGLILREA